MTLYIYCLVDWLPTKVLFCLSFQVAMSAMRLTAATCVILMTPFRISSLSHFAFPDKTLAQFIFMFVPKYALLTTNLANAIYIVMVRFLVLPKIENAAQSIRIPETIQQIIPIQNRISWTLALSELLRSKKVSATAIL